jgi:hypothetical protein
MYKSILLFLAILVFGLSVSARAAVYADSYMASTEDGFYVTGLDDQYETCYQTSNSITDKTGCLEKFIDRSRKDIPVSLKIIRTSCNKPKCAEMVKAIENGYQQFGASIDGIFNYSAPKATYARLALNATIIKGMQDTTAQLSTFIQNFDN